MKRPLLWASVGMCAGTLLGCFAHPAASVFCLLLLTVFLFLKVRKVLILSLFTGLLLGALSGVCYRYTSRRLSERILAADEVIGVVREVSAYGFRMRIAKYRIGEKTYSAGNLFPYYVYVSSMMPPGRDCTVSVTGYGGDFKKAENPGQFDASEYYPGVGCILSYHADAVTVIKQPNAVRRMILMLRGRIQTQIKRLFPKKTAGLPEAMLLGNRAAMEEDERELYERFGLAHILAVSGLHIGIFAELLLSFFLLFMPRRPAQTVTFLILLFYGMLCGFPVSCLRAEFTFFLSVASGRFRRSFDRLSANAFLLILVLFFAPYQLNNLSFRLSFAAGFLTALDSPAGPVSKEKSILQGFRTSLLLQTGLLPIQLSAFYTCAPVGIALNAFILFGIGFVFSLLLASLFLSFLFFPLGVFLAGPVHYAVLCSETVLTRLGTIRFLTIPFGHPGTVRTALFFTFFVSCLVLERKISRHFRMFLLLGFLFFVPFHTDTVIANLSVGQGDCGVILKGNTVIVIDCGSLSKSEVGEKILKPFLLYYGYDRVDYLFLSHTDEDHINGIRNCEALFGDVRTVYTDVAFRGCEELLQPAIGGKTVFRYTAGGESVSIGDIGIRFLNGRKTDESDPNELCQMLSVSISGYGFLFTGDVSAEVLNRIPEEELKKAYLLKVPHHGSRYSVCERFYELTGPSCSVISVGYNSYGHPSKEAVEIALRYGSELFITKEDGAVITTVRRGHIGTVSYLKPQNR